MRHLFLIFFWLTLVSDSNAQLILSGNYTGKNLYFQNTTVDKQGEFCTDSIYVNGTCIRTELNQGVFEVNLKSLGLSIEDSICVKIYHKPGCKPFLLQSFYTRKKQEALSIKIDSSILTLESRPSDVKEFKVDLYRWNKWISIGNLDTLGSFSLSYKTHSGLNLIRVVSIDKLGIKQPSNKVEYYDNNKKVTCKYSRKKKSLTFSRFTSFELYNSLGETVHTGNKNFIDLSNFKKGCYYLNFDNDIIKLKIR